MMKEISAAISALCQVIVKSTQTAEHLVDIADREVNLLEKRQDIRMAEINHELDHRQQTLRHQIEQL